MKTRCALLVGALLWQAGVAMAEITPIDEETQSTLLGGAAVDVTNISPGTRLGNDQIYLRGEIDHIFEPTSMKVYQNTGNGKAWYTTVSTPENSEGVKEGSWVSSWNYPLNEPPGDISIRVCNPNNGEGSGGTPCTIVPGTDGDIANVDINNNVRVYGVWFHNVTDGTQSAYVSPTLLRQLVDWWANGNRSDILVGGWSLPDEARNADEILDNCSVNSRIQLRYYRTDTVDASSWWPTSTDWTRFPVGSGYPWLPTVYGNYVASIDPGSNYLHVFIVNSITGSTVGLANGYSDNFVAIEDSYMNGASFRTNARLLTHELGHTQGLYHASSGCTGSTSSNVMCPSTGTFGDGITSTQCTTVYNSPAAVDNMNQ